jgi:hypothetical protein
MKLTARTLFAGVTTKDDLMHIVNAGDSYKAKLSKITEAFEYYSVAFVDATNGDDTTGRAGNILLPFAKPSAARDSLIGLINPLIVIFPGVYNEGVAFNYAISGQKTVYYSFPNVEINITSNEPFRFDTGFSNSRIEFMGYADVNCQNGSIYYNAPSVNGCSILFECETLVTAVGFVCFNPQGGKIDVEIKPRLWYLSNSLLGGTNTNNGHIHKISNCTIYAQGDGVANNGTLFLDTNVGSVVNFKNCIIDYTASNYNANYNDVFDNAAISLDHCTFISPNKSFFNGISSVKPFLNKCIFIIKNLTGTKYVFDSDEINIKMVGDSFTNTSTIKNGAGALYSATSYGEIRIGSDFVDLANFI